MFSFPFRPSSPESASNCGLGGRTSLALDPLLPILGPILFPLVTEPASVPRLRLDRRHRLRLSVNENVTILWRCGCNLHSLPAFFYFYILPLSLFDFSSWSPYLPCLLFVMSSPHSSCFLDGSALGQLMRLPSRLSYPVFFDMPQSMIDSLSMLCCSH
jgi:hypothetical protein